MTSASCGLWAIQQEALSPNDFTDLDVIEQRLVGFKVRYNEAAKSFK